MKTVITAVILSLGMLAASVSANANSYYDYPSWASEAFKDASDKDSD